MEVPEAKEIRKLVEKAELTRYIHARLAEKRSREWKFLQLAVAILGMLVSILAAIYFRIRSGQEMALDSMWEEIILLGVIILPAVATTIVLVDATVLRLRDREEEHKSAVKIWGNWIRKAYEARMMNDASGGSRQLQKNYRKGMKETPSTSMRTFLRFKKEWIRYKNESIGLDKKKDWSTDKECGAREEGESGS